MNQLYSNELNRLNYVISVKGEKQEPDSTPIATIKTGTLSGIYSTISSLDVVEEETGVYSVSVPHDLLSDKRFAKVAFVYDLSPFGEVVREQEFEITQRVISFEDYNEYIGADYTGESEGISFAEFDKAESISRKVIESFCYQKFNYWHGTRDIEGPYGYIPLPQHLDKLEGVTFYSGIDIVFPDDYAADFVLAESGNAVMRKSPQPKLSIFTYPYEQKIRYAVTGYWGFHTIPEEVKRSAYELIRYYNSDEADQRFRYKNSYSNSSRTSETDNVTINFNAYKDSTGNPVVDQMLYPYRLIQIRAV